LGILVRGFPFSRLRAEALLRASTGMTESNMDKNLIF